MERSVQAGTPRRPHTALTVLLVLITLAPANRGATPVTGQFASAPVAARRPDDPTLLRQTLPERWRWRELLREDAPPSFRCVRPGPDGSLLLCDARGLWRYDGLHWTAVPGSDALDLAGLIDVRVLGTDWLLSTPRRLNEFVPGQPGQLTSLLPDEPNLGFTRPVQAPDGRLVCAVGTRLLQITPTGSRPDLPGPPGVSQILGLAFDHLGRAWCSTDLGLFRHDGRRWEAIPPPSSGRGTGDYALIVPVGKQLVILPRVFSSGQSGLLWDGQELHPMGDAEAQGEVLDALVTPGGELVVVIHHAGVRLAQGSRWVRAELPPSFDESLVSVAMTSDGKLAAITTRGHLLLHDHASRRWERFDPWAEAHISSIVNALAPARTGGLWLGTHEGVVRFANGQFHERFQHAEGINQSLYGVTAVFEDQHSRLWVGAGGDLPGVLSWDGRGWQHHADPAIFAGAGVHAIRQGPDGSLWFLMLGQRGEGFLSGGIAILDNDGWHVERGASGQRLGRTYSLVFEPGGAAVAGLLGGLGRRVDGRWTIDQGEPFGNDSKAFSLHRSRDGTLWAGMDLHVPGVARLRPGAGPHDWEPMTGPGWDGVFAGAFAETSDGDLWIASESGINRVRDGLCLAVSTEGVIPGGSCWPILADPDDDSLWIGSLGAGLLHLRPDDNTGPASQLVSLSHPDQAAWDTRRVSWRCVDAWGRSPPESLRHRWRLDGAPWSAWSQPGQEPGVELAGLAPGPHEFEIQGLDASGNREQPPLRTRFELPDPPLPLWARPPILALISLLTLSSAALVLLLVHRRREQRTEARARTQLNERLRDLSSRLMSTQEEERRRLARDLHDDLGQLLTVTALHLEHGLSFNDEARRGEALGKALTSAHAAIDSVRSLAARVRPTSLDDLGLEAAVRSTLDEFASSTGMQVSAELIFERSQIPDTAASHVYRILKEGLTNVVRHAGAHRVEVALSVTERTIDLSLCDDGRGFTPPVGPVASGVGLLGMRERAESLNGQFSIDSAPGQGARITISIPLDESTGEDDAP